MQRFELYFIAVNKAVLALTLAAIFLIVSFNVVGRYGFGNSLSWGEEAARHLMIFGTFAGAGLALREGRLVSIDVLPDLFPAALQRAMRWGVVIAMFVFMTALLWLGWEFTIFGMRNETVSTNMPRAVPYFAIPFGCAIFLIHLAFFAGRFVRREFEIVDDMTADGGADGANGGTGSR